MDYLSWFSVVDEADSSFVLTSESFLRREDAEAWLVEHKDDLIEAERFGTITGAKIKEDRREARFLVVSKAASPNYLGFGARVLGETQHFNLVGIPKEHVRWQAQRLGSGLHFYGPSIDGLPTLEEARIAAQELEARLYG